MTKTVAIVQARMSSNRFPGKVLEHLHGLPSIVFLVERARGARTIDQVVVATSDDASDQVLIQALHERGIECITGELQDVLGRFVKAARHFGATEIIRLTGDCPLIDPKIIDSVVMARRRSNADYASNVDPPTFPDGLDVECFTMDALLKADAEARSAAQREHVTVWMREPGSGLTRVNVRGLLDCSFLRLTVDYPDDLSAVRQLIDAIGKPHTQFDFFDMLRALSAQPQILSMNPHARNEGLQKSLDSGE